MSLKLADGSLLFSVVSFSELSFSELSFSELSRIWGTAAEYLSGSVSGRDLGGDCDEKENG